MILVVAVLFGSRASAAVYLQDGFNYPAGSLMFSNSPWGSFNGTNFGNTNLCVFAWTNSLAYTNGGQVLQDFSPSGVALLVTNNGNEGSHYWCINDNLNTNLSGGSGLVVYTSFLVQRLPNGFSGTPGAGSQDNKNCCVMELTCTNNLVPRGTGGDDLQFHGGTTAWDFQFDSIHNYFGVIACASGTTSTNFADGVSIGQANTAFYSNSIVATNVTYFVVLKYVGSNNSASLYINPVPGGTEPATPNLLQRSSGNAFPSTSKLGAILLNSANAITQRAPIVIDSLRVGGTWADVAPAAPAAIATTTALVLSSGSNASAYGSSLTFQATVSPTPPDGENVIFYNGASPMGTNTTASGVASRTTSALLIGTNLITAVYVGDGTYVASTNSPALSQTVNLPSGTTTNSVTAVSSSANPSVYGQSGVTFTAVVTSPVGTPTGTVQFQTNGANFGGAVTLASGSASSGALPVNLPAGNYTVTAAYGGDANFNPSSGTLSGGQRVISTIYVQDGFNYPAGSYLYTNSPWTVGILGNTNLGLTLWTGSLVYTNGGQILQGFSPPGYAVLETNYVSPSSWFVYDEFATNLVLQSTANHAIYTSFLINIQPSPDTGSPTPDVATGQGNPNCSVMEMGTTNALVARGTSADLQLGGGNTAWDFMYDAVNRSFGVEVCAAPAGATNWNVVANTYQTNLATAWYTNAVIGTNVTYFVVLKYSTTDDSVSMYINPTPGSAEPAPNLVQWGHGAFDSLHPLGYISLNTGNGANQRPPTVIDSLRVSTNWADVTPAALGTTATTTTLILASGSNPSTYGDTLTFQATVSPTPPNGENVIFYNGASPIGTNTTASGVASLTTSSLPPGTDLITAVYVGDFTYAASTSSPPLSLTVNTLPPKAVEWGGGVNNNWDISTLNWTNSGVITNYSIGDFVTFDDLGQTNTVNLTTTLSPGSLTVTNSAKNYTFNGSGSLSGSAALIKQGSGTLTLAETGGDSFTGGIAVSNGTVVIDNNGGSISGGTTIASGGVVQLGNSDTNGVLPLGAVADNGALVFSRTNSVSITNIISGTGAVTNAGSGTITMNVANGYSGGLTVLNGRIQGNNANSLGANGNVVTVASGAQAYINGDVDMANPFVIAGSGDGTGAVKISQTINKAWSGNITLNGNALIGNSCTSTFFPEPTFTGTISGTGNLEFGNYSAIHGCGINLNPTSGANTWNGNLTITCTNGNYFGLYLGPVGGAGNGNSIPNTCNVTIQSPGTGGAELNLWNATLTIAGLNSAQSSACFVGNEKTGSGTLVVGNGNANGNFGGILQNGTVTGNILNLIKIGAGTQALKGVNTYTGTTTISNGTLEVDGSLPSGSAVTVNGGTLGGIGTVSGPTTVNAGAALAAGNGGIGTLTFGGNLTLSATSTNRFVVTSTSGGVASNQVVVAGTLTPNNSIIEINTAGDSALGVGTNVLFTYPSGVLGSSFTAIPVFETVQTGAATNALIVDDGVGHIDLVVSNTLAAPLLSTNAYLTSLEFSPSAGFAPAFASNVLTGYNETNAYGDTPTVTVTNADATATNILVVNGVSLGVLTNETASNPLTLGVGSTNVVAVQVVSQSGTVTNLYVVNVTRLAPPLSTNALLASLTITPAGTLYPM